MTALFGKVLGNNRVSREAMSCIARSKARTFPGLKIRSQYSKRSVNLLKKSSHARRKNRQHIADCRLVRWPPSEHLQHAHLAVHEYATHIPDMSRQDSKRARHRQRQARFKMASPESSAGMIKLDCGAGG